MGGVMSGRLYMCRGVWRRLLPARTESSGWAAFAYLAALLAAVAAVAALVVLAEARAGSTAAARVLLAALAGIAMARAAGAARQRTAEAALARANRELEVRVSKRTLELAVA